MKIIDTHCHLNDGKFQDDLPEVINRCRNAGVVSCYDNADSLESFQPILDLTKKYPGFLHAVLGIHPEFATKGKAYLEEAYRFIQDHRKDIVAIGEIGLDYHWRKDEETKKAQKEAFIEQIRLAKALDLPIVIHCRDADKDTLDILSQERPEHFDLHCYSGSLETFETYLRLGLDIHIGIGGVLTFKNARVLKEVVKKADIHRLLTETDCPYLAPTPHRGERNDPSYLPLVIQAISEIKEMDVLECAGILYRNAEEFYGRKE